MSDVSRSISALEARAREVLDPAIFDYYAGGSGQEVSLDEASAAWLRYRFAPRVLRAVGDVDTSVTVLGARLPGPVGIAPMAFQELLDPGGEVATATGAGDHLLVVSTRASRTIEQIAQVARTWWFQVYVTADRSLTTGLVKRAARAGASALVLTGDTPFVGVKARVGRVAPLGTEAALRNFAPHLASSSDPALDTDQSPDVTEEEIARLADESGLPVLVKGVLRADDAHRCLEAGAAGLVVSNHGGRQLDRALPSAAALAAVVAAAGDAPVLVDGGVRSGHDVLTALALGARAVLVGRPVAWALAGGGATGVGDLLAGFSTELRHVLALAGCRTCADVTSDLVVPL